MSTKAQKTAIDIITTAAKYGFTVSVNGSTMSITKSFTPGDKQAFTECDMMAGSVLEMLPRTRPGSDWGTDGGGVGGMVALTNGQFKMNRTGGSMPVLKALVITLYSKNSHLLVRP